MFKKVISLIIVISISLSIVGCQKRISAIESAEKHGYWHGFDGITWGMTIDECKSVLKLNDGEYEQSKMDHLKHKDISETEALIFKTNLYDTPVTVVLHFNDFAPFEQGTEWLYTVVVQPLEAGKFKYGDTLQKIDDELENLGLKYNKPPTAYECGSSISTISDSEIKEGAIALANEMYDNSPIKDELLKNCLNGPLDSIMALAPDSVADSEVSILSYNGTNAALVALAEQGRGL